MTDFAAVSFFLAFLGAAVLVDTVIVYANTKLHVPLVGISAVLIGFLAWLVCAWGYLAQGELLCGGLSSLGAAAMTWVYVAYLTYGRSEVRQSKFSMHEKSAPRRALEDSM